MNNLLGFKTAAAASRRLRELVGTLVNCGCVSRLGDGTYVVRLGPVLYGRKGTTARIDRMAP